MGDRDWWTQAACADVELAIVDAAFERQGGPEAHYLREQVCTRCPVGQECLTEAMTTPPYGIWGGTNSNMRVRHGGPSVHDAARAS